VAVRHYLTVEGVDASGKTTVVARVQAALRTHGIRCLVKPEFPPASDVRLPIEEALQNSIFVSDGFRRGPLVAFFFMLYAEVVAVTQSLADADLLLGDRGLDTLAIYQAGFALPAEAFSVVRVVTALEQLYRAVGLRVPDRTLLLSVPLPQVATRFRAQMGRDLRPGEVARIEWIQARYHELAAATRRFKLIDAAGSPSEVEAAVVAAVLEHVAEGQVNDSH
jgi:dTMP kinase